MALSAYADEGLQLFDSWSSTSPRYPGAAQIGKVFAGFKPRKVSVGTIFWMSKKAGHDPVAIANAEVKGAAPSGAAAFMPAEGGIKRGSTPKDAERLWNNGWTPAHAKDLPHGWGDDLNATQKGATRAKLERHRDVVRAHLSSRLGHDYVDHWVRQIKISRDGLMLIPMRAHGEVCGVQRTYFNDAGQKTERKMLGKQGVTVCPAPVGVAPVDLGIGKALLVGEGWETVASAVQATGWSGIAVQFDGGLSKWAREQADLAKKLTEGQRAAAPTAVFLVDHDVSHAGQKASAKAVLIMRGAGLNAVYAIPPTAAFGGPRGSEKGSDWGDYPREGISSDVLAAHLALAIAHSDREMPALDDPDAPVIEKAKNHVWRTSENPQSPATAGETEEVRAELQTALQKTVTAYLDWLKDKKKPFAPILMTPTTGTGKSTAAKAPPVSA